MHDWYELVSMARGCQWQTLYQSLNKWASMVTLGAKVLVKPRFQELHAWFKGLCVARGCQ